MDGQFFSMLLAQAETISPDVAETAASPTWWSQWQPFIYGMLYVFAIFVLPFIIGRFIARAIRMPNMAVRMGVALAALIAGILFIVNGQLLLSIDMKGGTTLVYNIVEAKDGEDINAAALASALSERIDPSGTREITIRPRGSDQVEITVPTDDPFELDRIKAGITTAGQLEFRVVANTRDHDDIITLARLQTSENRIDVLADDGRPVGRWYTVGREEKMVQGIYPLRTPVTGDIIRNSDSGAILNVPQLDWSSDYALEKWLDSQGIRNIDVLMALEFISTPYVEVFGDDLASAQAETSKLGEPIVGFRLSGDGANKMLQLTTAIMPDGSFKRRMAIIMDRRVLSAPSVNSPISNAGLIEGRFTREEIDFLVTILRSGRLPATLEKEPASETRVGAALGEITIRKGTTAAIGAIIVTFICILAYYLFAGVVASIALIINGILIFGVMIFIRQPLSLPGLAGLVLTVGMSVDANVLIFERIREERNKGSAPRLAIRNGFDKAFSTIIDANLTTLIAALVLYWIGTEQVRGFAVTLIIGICGSLFTAIFCSRILFDIAEKLKLVNLTMLDGVGFLKRTFFGERDLEFMSIRKACISASIAVIAVGMVAVFFRGGDILNIDFTGGTTVTIQLKEPVPLEELRRITKEILVDEDGKPIQSTLVRVEKDPRDTVFTLVTSMSDENLLAEQLHDGLARNNVANLVTYKAQVTPLSMESGWWKKNQAARARFVSLASPQEDAQAENSQSADTADTADAPQSEQAEVSDLTDTESDASAGEPAVEQVPQVVFSSFRLELSGLEEEGATSDSRNIARRSPEKLKADIVEAASAVGVTVNPALVSLTPSPRPTGWREDQNEAFSVWDIRLPVPQSEAQLVMDQLALNIESTPLWLSLSQIGGRVAGEMQQRAVAAILISLLFIVGYIWFRFQKISYGLAAVIALVHDVLITLGVIALCHWLAGPLGFLLIEDFKIGLTEVAAFLTIIGYSLNDTIVVFDRIREIRGRSPRLTAEMINTSINQTLSRTLLTSGTTLVTILLLYVFGGEGIHAFAFALLVGVLVGTYSSIFVAAPALYWLSNREAKASAEARA
jgi:SecD/SecF fusion protein